jgi:hypothetical protein
MEFWSSTKIDMARKKPNADVEVQSQALAELAANILIAAEQSGMRKLIVAGFSLEEPERVLAAGLPGLSSALKKKLAKEAAAFTFADTACLVRAAADSLPECAPGQRTTLLGIATKLTNSLSALSDFPAPAHDLPEPSVATQSIYQLKITLLDIDPPIWRRIQVQDCTLDQLHGLIQTAIGWTNSHMHQFDINGKIYGDPEFLDDGFDGSDCVDSTQTFLHAILPQTRKRFSFQYEYDFGDSWRHQILFEKIVTVDPQTKYPLCLEGEGACPPEDCGGVWGYSDLLEAINDPEHEDHAYRLEWVGGRFDSKQFDPKQATKQMQKGLCDEEA